MVIKTKPEVNISRPASVIRYVPGPTVRLFVSCESAQAMFSWSTCRRRMPAENAGRSILLLEAGQDYADPQMLPETVRDGGWTGSSSSGRPGTGGGWTR